MTFHFHTKSNAQLLFNVKLNQQMMYVFIYFTQKT